MGTYRTLTAWQKSMDLVDAVYRSGREIPKTELFSLTQQLKRASVSIATNLAEGSGRYTVADQQHFYRQARGSVYELQTEIEIAVRQKFIASKCGEELMRMANEVGRLINGLLNKLRTKD